MAFMSMFVAGIALIILLIGFLNLVVGFILDLIWIIRAACKKKTHILLKIPGVIFTLVGIFLFVVPVLFFGALGALGQAAETKRYDSIETKIFVSDSEWQEDGFDYNGKHLVPIDFLSIGVKNSEVNKLEPVGAVVYDNGNYYRFYEIENDGGFHLYSFEKLVEDDYCYEEEVDQIKEYYTTKAEYNVTINHYEKDSDRLIADPCEFDIEKLFEIASYYEKGDADYEMPLDDKDVDYYIQA